MALNGSKLPARNCTGTYVGWKLEKLKGQTALLKIFPDGRVLAQFDDQRLGVWAYGWHQFRRSDWKVDPS